MPRFLENTLKKTPSSGKSLSSTYLMFFGWEGPKRGLGGGGHLLEFHFEGEGGGVGVHVGTYSRLGVH